MARDGCPEGQTVWKSSRLANDLEPPWKTWGGETDGGAIQAWGGKSDKTENLPRGVLYATKIWGGRLNAGYSKNGGGAGSRGVGVSGL